MILIIWYIYGMSLTCINILPFKFDDLQSNIFMSSTLVAPYRWLQFAAETCNSIKTNCATGLE